MPDFNDLTLIHRLESRVEQLELKLSAQDRQLVALREREADDRGTISSLVELLVDGKQVDAQKLKARIEAAKVSREHAAREELAASQNVWDAAGPGSKVER